MLNFLRDLHVRHERLKKTIHEGWRYPLPPWGRAVMACFYFSVPVVGGWYVMQWAISKSHASIGEQGERLPVKTVQGIGDKMIGEDGQVVTHVGAGGWGGGVNLAVSDEETQQRNRKMLNKFLRQQKRRQKEEEGEGNATNKVTNEDMGDSTNESSL